MGYQALLFCPDEKIARTVTQVLSELEFAVEPCIEPFAAVKKLMAEHFDAVVVDCDNDQNASLLFKSARNSSINQAALAVAVVEGQAGVAKAFRIGANLVLTKPINVEQAKGTLRVARGLLRKGEGAKPSAPATAAPSPSATVPPPPASAKPPITVPAAPARPATLSAATARPRPVTPTAPKPAAANPAAVAASASTANSAPVSAMETGAVHPATKTDPVSLPSTVAATPANAASLSTSSGAASAPAPAREAAAPVVEAAPAQKAAAPEKISEASAHVAESKPSEPATTAAAPAPTFTFGGANLPEKSESGGNKKIFLIVAAAALLVCAIYFGWTQLHEKLGGSATTSNPAVPAPTRIPAATQPPVQSPATSASGASSLSTGAAQPQPPVADITLSTTDGAAEDSDGAAAPVTSSKHSAASPATKSASDSKPSAQPNVAQPTAVPPSVAAPIVVKSGATKSSAKAAPADTAAPSMDGLAATTGSGGSLSNLTAGDNAAKPILQTLTISQGVSQGLLLKKVQPEYPATALRMRTEGAVKLLATVGTTGNVTDVKVVSGDPLLTRSASDAVKQWKYKPYLLNGDPVEIQTEVTINFRLPH